MIRLRFRNLAMKSILLGALLALLFWNPAGAAGNFQELEKILGAKGQLQEGAWLARFPRNDLAITIVGEPMATALGFVSWAAFKDMGKHAMVMGDLVLLEKEANPVISALQENGLQVTALHNHFFYEEPRIMFMHIGGMGELISLAKGLRLALDKTATPKTAAAAAPAPTLALDTKRLEQIIGHPGQTAGGAFKITVGRKGIKMDGAEVTSSMGLNSWAGFVGTDDKTHVAGDIVMAPKEVNPVIQALRKGGIEVVAVHNHMITEQPRVLFLHYWGTGPAESLAHTVRVAFDLVKAPVL